MTSSRIAKVLQPVILSPVKAGEYLIEEDTFSELSQDVLIFLIEFQMMDMAGVSVRPMDGTPTTIGSVWHNRYTPGAVFTRFRRASGLNFLF